MANEVRLNHLIIKSTFIVVFIVFWLTLPAQNHNDTLHLETVEIVDQRLEQVLGYHETKLTKRLVTDRVSVNLADFLNVNTSIFIKSYANGGLVTTSSRGASASHTEVLWNGINLNSTMNGNADISQIPLLFVDKINVGYGGGISTYNSSGLTGAIDLATETNWQNRFSLELKQDISSFNTYRTYFLCNVGNYKFQSSTRFFYETSENNYPFLNNTLNGEKPQKEYRTNASFDQTGLLQELNWNLASNTNISLKAWIQENDRNLPSNILTKLPNEKESSYDQIARAVVEMKQQFYNSKLEFTSGIFQSRSNYKKKTAGINSDHITFTSANKLRYKYSGFKNLMILTDVGFDFHNVKSDNYDSKRERGEGKLKLNLQYFGIKKFVLNGSVIQKLVDHTAVPLISSFGIGYRVSEKNPIILNASVTRNVRIPSFNDLYWTPGGNPYLKNEKGIIAETGITIERNYRKTNLKGSISLFHNKIDDWIIWQPDTLFSYWRPFNLKKGISQGIEAELTASGALNQLKWNYSLTYAFTSAKNKSRTSGSDKTINKQLIYVPKHIANQSISVSFKSMSASYVISYTGKRFTNPDHYSYLQAYFLQDFAISKSFELGGSTLNCQFTIHNIFNQQYQIIAWYPMPGRHLSFSIKYNFKNSKS